MLFGSGPDFQDAAAQNRHINCQLAVSTTSTPQTQGGIGSQGKTTKRLWHCGQKFGPSRFLACRSHCEQWGQ
jgi:hypothetical protein